MIIEDKQQRSVPVKITSKELEAAIVDARLSFTPEEQEALRQNIERVLDQVQGIKEDCTDSDSPPLFYPHEVKNIYREDRQEKSLPRETALANGPDTDTSCFHVPRIIEG
jgi:aspartyl-tRNA(Asn)/glutamyl-tRNA(Gln) amidotransferase subunit C